ncbi:hypothetical protein BDZ94DRAFT_1062733 [Collybia nuda]|uniref:FAD-binding domain-containing protein n=1 Tax=Collybia nuda TaxID=64659 RepID=A0A9P5XYR9_9AGAR|nr:hypothetical protein BDZ94DRAFT_1062733 [Collybia nuda]
MGLTNKSTNQASCTVHFLIIGGGIAGLACATALRRVGHRVTVLEKDNYPEHALGGCRMAPNLTKILYHWGLEEEVQAIAIKSESIALLLYESGEHLGRHRWAEEDMEETEGEFVLAQHSAFWKLLFDTARAHGADIRLNTHVSSVDLRRQSVTLESGQVLQADIIIGADGPTGLTREILQGKAGVAVKPGVLNMYSTTIPKARIMEDPELTFLYGEQTNMYSWLGNEHCVVGFPTGDTQFALYAYGPNETPGERGRIAPKHELDAMLATSEPRLRKLAQLADPPTQVPLDEYPELDNWVHEGGRLVVIGEAAHPLPSGSVQACAMAVEDGAVLAKLFSHLRTKDQISSFLWAFQDLRQPRCNSVVTKELRIIHFMTMPPGERQESRDSSMRAKRDAGIGILQAYDNHDEPREWTEIKEVFGYDAEDEADNWWVEWGILRERSMGVDVSESSGTLAQRLRFPRHETYSRHVHHQNQKI